MSCPIDSGNDTSDKHLFKSSVWSDVSCPIGSGNDTSDEQPQKAPPPMLLYKRDLLRRKFDEEVAEPWVQCDSCHRWVHQTCAAFNERADKTTKGQGARFCCPECEANTKVPPMKVSLKVGGRRATVMDARPKEEAKNVERA